MTRSLSVEVRSRADDGVPFSIRRPIWSWFVHSFGEPMALRLSLTLDSDDENN